MDGLKWFENATCGSGCFSKTEGKKSVFENKFSLVRSWKTQMKLLVWLSIYFLLSRCLTEEVEQLECKLLPPRCQVSRREPKPQGTSDLAVSTSIVDRTNLLWSSTDLKSSVKHVKRYLFLGWTRRDPAHCFVQCVNLVSCSHAFEYLLCFVHGQGQQTKEIENKNLKQRKWPTFTTSWFC